MKIAKVVQKILLQIDPEKAHAIGQRLINIRYSRLFSRNETDEHQCPVTRFGLDFPNPIGLAAGWDKNGVCVDALFRMGFGFVEVGTVTPRPQSGNPKPRLFRIPEKKALINRMGFNNDGVDALINRLKKRKVSGVLGINIGKNKDTLLSDALSDYRYCLEKLYRYADYFVVNISSPNTPGLRELQTQDYLQQLLQGIQDARQSLQTIHQINRPVLVKTTIDLPKDERTSFAKTLLASGVDGLIVSNTTVDHSAVIDNQFGQEQGGLSGAPLRDSVSEMIAEMKQLTDNRLLVIGVGGVLSGEDAKAHWQAGADLLQLYTGFVYHGPSLIHSAIQAIRPC